MTTFFGKYQVIELVGEGGFGKVYKGYDPTLKRYVAIKTCTLRHPDIRARFTREAEIAANLRHPNIVTVYDFGEHEGEPYLVQEFLAGEDLDGIIGRKQPVELATKVRYLVQLAEGLAFAHRHGVVHRDVKPGNVRVQPDGLVRIMDFGIAKLLEAEQQLTQTGLSVGTTGYLAPEQLSGQEIDHRADIFSYGVLAYELIGYRRPFEGDSITSIFYKIAHEEPPPVGQVAPDCPPRLAALIERCLKKNREERFAHLGLVKEELETVLAELRTGVAAGAAPAGGASAAFAGGAPAAAGTAAAGAAASGSDSKGAAETSPAASRPSRWRTYGGLTLAAAAVAVFAVFSVARWGRSSGSAGDDGATASGPAGPAAPTSGTGGVATPAGPLAAAGAAAPTGAPGSTTAPAQPPTGQAANPDAKPAGPPAAGKATPADAGATPSSPAPTAPSTPTQRPSPASSGGTAGQPPAGTPTRPAAGGASAPAVPAPAPAPVTKAAPALRRTRVLALVQGEEDGGLDAAESALLSELLAHDLDPVDRNEVSEIQQDRAAMRAAAGGNTSRIAELGRQFGAGTVLVGSVRAQAIASVGQFFTGSAVFTLKVYDAATGRLIGAESFQVGSGQTPGKLGPTPEAAVSAAAEEVGRQAARATARRLGN